MTKSTFLSGQPQMDSQDYDFVAYEVSPSAEWSIRPAEASRKWMTEMGQGFPYRCLPMVVSNQLGWIIECPIGFEVVWNGKPNRQDCITFHFDDDYDLWNERILCHFGGGIITFRLPWLFRTPEGIGLLVRGPANSFKTGINPLEGYVETDWSPFTFTMNWQMNRPDFKVRFEKGEPICMLVPFPKGFLETLEPRFASLTENPALKDQYDSWRRSREKFNSRLKRRPREWQKHYLSGEELGTNKPTVQISLGSFRPSKSQEPASH